MFPLLLSASDHISVLSEQNSDLARHMSFQKEKFICSPAKVTNSEHTTEIINFSETGIEYETKYTLV